MKKPIISPFFLDSAQGRIYCLSVKAQDPSPPLPPVLFVPPFAEEMNKSRHFFRALAQILAESGSSCLLFDLFGTGDSEGDFQEATWEIWIEDLRRVHQWLEEESGQVSVIGLRSGVLLTTDFVQRFCPNLDRLVFLAPALKGENYLSQFLRLRIAAEMAESKPDKATVGSLKNKLQSGDPVEVAGYSLSPSLAQGIMGSAVDEEVFRDKKIRSIDWVELTADIDRPIAPVIRQVVDLFVAAGLPVTLHKFCAPAFWSAVEIVENPELLVSIRDIFQAR